jgi:SAM-dependent methyltransferase
MKKHLDFYRAIDRETKYTVEKDPERHPFYTTLLSFIERWDLRNKRCLEIGSSKGLFQDMILDYTGVDVAEGLAHYYHKKYVVISDARLPFLDSHFDGIFTYATHEHIPDLETALEEIVRVLKPGGVCLFAPAWHTRPWFAGGHQVRRFEDLDWKEKLVKCSIPVRDFSLIRWPKIILRRLLHLIAFFWAGATPKPLKYIRLTANYETYWQSDSDACNSLDTFDVILWFRSRKMTCHGYDNLLKALFVRTYALELQKP